MDGRGCILTTGLSRPKLADAIEKTEGDSEERRDLFRRFATELEAHAAAEEGVLYASLLATERTRAEAAHSIEEHEEARKIVSELEDMEMSSTGWLTRFKTLAHDVRHHVDEEEEDAFRLARKVLSDERRVKMAREFRDLKAQHAGQ